MILIFIFASIFFAPMFCMNNLYMSVNNPLPIKHLFTPEEINKLILITKEVTAIIKEQNPDAIQALIWHNRNNKKSADALDEIAIKTQLLETIKIKKENIKKLEEKNQKIKTEIEEINKFTLQIITSSTIAPSPIKPLPKKKRNKKKKNIITTTAKISDNTKPSLPINFTPPIKQANHVKNVIKIQILCSLMKSNAARNPAELKNILYDYCTKNGKGCILEEYNNEISWHYAKADNSFTVIFNNDVCSCGIDHS